MSMFQRLKKILVVIDLINRMATLVGWKIAGWINVEVNPRLSIIIIILTIWWIIVIKELFIIIKYRVKKLWYQFPHLIQQLKIIV
jgi:hypothetical protein